MRACLLVSRPPGRLRTPIGGAPPGRSLERVYTLELTAAPLQAVKHAAAAGENTAIDSRVTAAEALVREVSVDGSTKTRGGTWVEAVAASGGGRPLFAAAGGKSVTMFGLEGGREATKFADVGSTVTALQFMGEGDGRRELAASCYGGVSVWEDTAEEDAAPSSQHAYKGALECCVSSPGAGTWLVAGCNDHSVRIWFRPIEARNFEMGGYMAKITRAAFEPASGRYMVTNGGNVPMVWDFSGDGPNGRIPVGLFGHDGVVRELAWAPGAKEPMAKDAMVPAGVAALATSADDNTVLVWDVTQWEKGMPHRCFPFAAAEPGEKITALRWTRRAGLVCCLENGDVVCYQLPRPMTAAAQGGEELLPGDGSGQ